jgi:glycosyltransferase involved in cell wall biosynthesis
MRGGEPTATGYLRRITVVHLSSGHDQDDARIYWKECRSLAQAGYSVAFVVPDWHRSRGTGRISGVDVVTVPCRISRLGRLLALPVSVLLAGLRLNGDVYHFHDPELLPAGFILHLLCKRVIYDSHEDMPRDILIKPWIPRSFRWPIGRAMAAVEWLAGRTFSGIVAATPVIARRFPQERTALVQNFARSAEFEPCQSSSTPETPVIAYVGSITVERCAIEMVLAMDRLSYSPSARLVIAGGMAPTRLIDDLVALPGWRQVDYRGHLDRDGVRSVLAQASIGLALFHPVQSYIDSQPVKLFEYMAAGIPVIASDFPRFRCIIETHGCGVCVPPRDVDAIAAAIDRLLANPNEAKAMGQRGRALMLRSFSWESEERSLLHLYKRIACVASASAMRDGS